jgi:hypothetical protein
LSRAFEVHYCLNIYRDGVKDFIRVEIAISSQESLDAQWRNTELRLQDLEGKKGFLGLFDNQKQKNKDFQVEVSQIFSTTKKLIQDNFDYQVHKTALAIVDEVLSCIRSLVLESSWIDQLLVSVESSYKKRWEDLERLNPDDITGEALFSPEDANVCYLEFLPEQNEKSILIDISEEMLTEKFAFSEKSLMHFLIKVTNEEITSAGSVIHYLVGSRDVDEQLVGGNIADAIDKRFGTQSIGSLQPVMARFLQKYPLASSDAERRMRQIISEAQPLLPLLTRDGHFYEDGGNKSEIIAFERTDSRPSQQLQELLTRNVGIPESTIKSIQNDSEIVIVNEYAAFPLRLIRGIGRMREHYDRECQQNRARIHNDYQQIFAEIIPPEARLMEEMQDAFYACLAFGVLIQQDNCYLYEVYDEFRDRKSYIELSLTWSEALEQISKAGGVANSLRDRRNSIIAEIQSYPDRWIEVYLPQLQSFIKKIDGFSKENPNYHEIGVVLGEEGTLDRHATEGILKRLWKYLDKIAKEAQDNPMNRHKKLQTQSSVGDEEVIDADIADVHSL